jgi:sensor histidine kinase YesM
MVPVLVISILRNRQYEALNAQLQREAEQARLARELSESQLRLLRAQIEPHFLFNTLGAVQQLAQHGAPRAAELTGNLIDFLRSSMRDMRSEQVCPGRRIRSGRVLPEGDAGAPGRAPALRCSCRVHWNSCSCPP